MSLRFSAGVATHLVFIFTLAAVGGLGAVFHLETTRLSAAASGADARSAAQASLTELIRAAHPESVGAGPLAEETAARFETAAAQSREMLAALAAARPGRAPMLQEAETSLAALTKRFPEALQARGVAERLRRDARARVDAGGDAAMVLRALLSREAEAQRLERQALGHLKSLERSLMDATAAPTGPRPTPEPALLTAGAAGAALLLWLLSYALIRARFLKPVARLNRALEALSQQEGSGGEAGRRPARADLAALAEAIGRFQEDAETLRRRSAESAAEAEATREQVEALLQGLALVNDAEDEAAMYEGVLRLIKRLAPYDAAALLVEDERGVFNPVASADGAYAPRFDAEEAGLGAEGDPLPPAQSLAQADYRLAAKIKGAGFRSALIAPLATARRRALVICACRGKDAFDAEALRALKAFAPVAEQALRGAEQMAALETTVDDLDAQAHHCSLTGLKNRPAFMKEIDRRRRACAAWERGEEIAEAGAEGPFALLHIDLDHFKAINDAMGHAAGDHALVWAARVISKTMRRRDFVARMGGDEFAVICEDDFEEGELQSIGDRLVRLLSRPFDYEGKTLQMGASIGVGRYPADSDDPEQILHIADMALLEAKGDGRGRCGFFNGALRREMERRQLLETRLREALEEGRVDLWHQPLVDLRDRRVAGIEARLHWEDPRLGVIEPEEFLPVAEHAGLIGEIGEWALAQACADLGEWAREEPGRRIAVAVGGAQLSTPDFAPELERILEENGLRPQHLEILTQTAVAMGRSAAMALQNLAMLQERGFSIAFDGFGEGAAALQPLRPFKGQRAILPARFLAGAGDADMGAGLVALASSLGLRVSAKGIAREADLDAAAALGCSEAQGDLFGRAAPLKDALIRAERIDERKAQAMAAPVG